MPSMALDGVVNRCGFQRRNRPVVLVMDMSDGRCTFSESSAKRHARGGGPLQGQRSGQQPRQDDAKGAGHETSLANRTDAGPAKHPMATSAASIMTFDKSISGSGTLQMLKKVAIGIGIVAALLLLAGVAAALLIDVNRYKPTLERMVTDATGRKLTIDGRLSLQMFPRLGVALPKSMLSGPGGNGAFASLSSASVAVAWLPLLTGRVVVDQVNVNGLQAALERRADGRSNIDDLLQRRKAAPKASSDCESSAISVSIRGISLNDANLSLRSADGSTIVLSKLNLEVDDIAATDYRPVRLSSSVKSSKPAVVADLTLTAEMLMDAANSRYGVRDLDGVGKGHFRPATDGDQAGRGARGLAAARRRRREARVRLDLAGHTTARAARHQR